MKKFINLIYSFYAWALTGILFLSAFLLSSLKSIGSKNRELIYNSISHKITKILFKLLGVNINIQGQELIPQNYPVIFIVNHQSFIDINLLHSVIPVPFSFLSKKEMFSAPLIGWHMKLSGHLPIDRENKKDSYISLDKIIKKAQNKPIVIFPEGTRSNDGTLGNFKRGGMVVISKTSCPVVPIAIIGTNKLLPKKNILFDFYSRNIKVKFGHPIHFSNNAQNEREETIKLQNELKTILEALLNSIQR